MADNMTQEQMQQQGFPMDLMQGTPLTQEQAMALQNFHMGSVLPVITTPNFPRPTVKRRKPVKWEHWEEKNLIEGVRRFGRGNWAQIRAAFEFNPCRTNVDLHDKWRVLTGERKRNRTRNGNNSDGAGGVITAEIQHDNSNNQKVQLIPVAGANGLYTLSSFLPAGLGFDGQHVQFPAEFLQGLHQNELMVQEGGDQMAPILNHHLEQEHQEQISPEMEETSTKKRQKKNKDAGDEDEVAQELLKLSSNQDDGTGEEQISHSAISNIIDAHASEDDKENKPKKSAKKSKKAE
jgi:Myb-like DNA-binding domain